VNIFKQLQDEVISVVKKTFPEIEDFSSINVEYPRSADHGDFSTNAAMVLKNSLGKNPRDIAKEIIEEMSKIDVIDSAEVAGPGFINFRVKNNFWTKILNSIITKPEIFGSSNIGNNQKVNLEFVSANPTGPLHIGHARGAIFGDALSRMLKKCNFDVTKEYYINDTGTQIETLSKSALIRYKQALGQNAVIGEGMYPGDYLIEIGNQLKQIYGDGLLQKSESEAIQEVRQYVVDQMMQLIKEDLLLLDIKHDVYTSEKNDLEDKGLVDEGINYLKEKNLVYVGTLEPPKGTDPKNWKPEEMTIFKATEFGDDSDRAVIRANGKHTYIAGDIAYSIHKFRRGFKDLILVLGADHIGYVKRMKAIVKAISNDQATIDVPISQLVNLYKNGEPFKMSKRAGNFITVRDVVEEVGKDILRFVMLTKKPDTIIEFDFEKVKEHSKDNPVFYVQYASARASSIGRKASDDNLIAEVPVDFSTSSSDICVIKKLAEFPKILETATLSHEPHRLTYYLHELATEFHSFWAKGNESEEFRFFIENDAQTTSFRIALAHAVKIVIKEGLDILGIKALDSM
jgi:arginyl-tRNA synthetase